jgi:sugar/nucleoside kinase (ribokinase family)
MGFGEDARAIERLFALRAGRAHGAVIVTRGARGAFAHVGHETIEVAGRARIAVDATGAGDAFMAGLLARLRRSPLEDVAALTAALQLADRLARDVVGHLGARPSGSAVRAARRGI